MASPSLPTAPPGDSAPGRPGRLRRALHRLAADSRELEAEDLQDEVRSCGATAMSSCAVGHPVDVAGSLRQVRLRPRAGVPAVEAELYDGSGSVTLVWLGRRRIAGIDPGRSLVAHGRLTEVDGALTLYNPRYELRAAGGMS